MENSKNNKEDKKENKNSNKNNQKTKNAKKNVNTENKDVKNSQNNKDNKSNKESKNIEKKENKTDISISNEKNNNENNSDKSQGKSVELVPMIISIIFLLLVIVLVLVVFGNNSKNSTGDKKEGYAKLLSYNEDEYTYLFEGNKIKTYTGYSDMSDFYYNTTCVSKKLEENKYISEDALINTSEKVIVDFGTYDDISQIANGKYYKVEKDDKYGVISYKGNVVIPVQYTYIMVTSIQNEKEYVFIGEKENEEYDYINESGKIFLNSQGESYLSNISYYNKFNDEYDTIISLNLDDKNRYFDLTTGEEVLKDEENLNFKYNMQIKEGKVIIYNKDMSVKEEIDTTGSYSVSSDVYFGKYIVLGKRTLVDGKRENIYTVYDEDYNEIFKSEAALSLVQDEKENIYFVTTGNDGVEIYNKKGLVAKIDGCTFTSSSNEKSKYIAVKKLTESKYDIYDFKGNIIVQNVDNYRYSDNVLVITRKDDNGEISESILLDKDKEVQISSNDTITSTTGCVIVENTENNTLSVYDISGDLLFDSIQGIKDECSDDYIFVKSDNMYKIYSIDKKEQVFEYNLDDFVSMDDELELLELKDGYYTYDGEKLLDVTE